MLVKLRMPLTASGRVIVLTDKVSETVIQAVSGIRRGVAGIAGLL